MKSNSKRHLRTYSLKGIRPLTVALGLLLVAGTGVLILDGCQNSVPALGVYGAPESQVNRDLVADFSLGNLGPTVPANQPPQGPVTTSTGAKVQGYPINHNLFEMSNPPNYTLKTPGSVTILNNFAAYCTPQLWGLYGPGANGAAYGYLLYGTVKDLGDSTFPDLEINAVPEGGAFYDASNFTGVQFYLLVANDDTTLHRVFSIPIDQTVPPSGGGSCPDAPNLCYDPFAADISGGTSGQWMFFRYNFSDLKQLVGGVITKPPTLSGVNLQQFFWLAWAEGRNNKPGLSVVDMSVDDIEFFK